MSAPEQPLPAAGLTVGDVVAQESYPVTRAHLVRYAGASGDFNPIHWNTRIATAVGLPDVIAHGMFTMAQAGRALVAWAGDPGRIESFAVRFSRPVVVPDTDEGTRIQVTIRVAEILTSQSGTRVRVGITATAADTDVLGQATAVVRYR